MVKGTFTLTSLIFSFLFHVMGIFSFSIFHLTTRARSQLHSAGPHASFTARCSCLHMRWELFLVGNQCDNTQSNSQMLTSLSLFLSYLMEFLHMPKELDGFSDWRLSHWFSKTKSYHGIQDDPTILVERYPNLKEEGWRFDSRLVKSPLYLT